jgi:hypothetical protein
VLHTREEETEEGPEPLSADLFVEDGGKDPLSDLSSMLGSQQGEGEKTGSYSGTRHTTAQAEICMSGQRQKGSPQCALVTSLDKEPAFFALLLSPARGWDEGERQPAEEKKIKIDQGTPSLVAPSLARCLFVCPSVCVGVLGSIICSRTIAAKVGRDRAAGRRSSAPLEQA